MPEIIGGPGRLTFLDADGQPTGPPVEFTDIEIEVEAAWSEWLDTLTEGFRRIGEALEPLVFEAAFASRELLRLFGMLRCCGVRRDGRLLVCSCGYRTKFPWRLDAHQRKAWTP